MDTDRVLLVEDDEASAKLVQNYLVSKGFPVDLARNGKDALYIYLEKKHTVLLTDLEMPEMSGEDLIVELMKNEDCPLFFILTAHQDPEKIVELMKMGVYDYLVKPINLNDLYFRILKAFDHARVLRANKIFQRERVVRLENQLEWYKWQERVTSTSKKNAGNTMFHDMLMSFNQGAGFGAMVTLLNLIEDNAVKDGDNYLIESFLFETVVNNNKIAEKAMDTFSAISGVIDRGLKLEPVTVIELCNMIYDVCERNYNKSKIKKQKIVVCDTKPVFERMLVEIDKPQLAKVINELMINAFKYSRAGTSILVIVDFTLEKLYISVSNLPEKDEKGRMGIPIEYENIIFEPFFRLRKSVQEEYGTLDFGLGLTLVEKIVHAHKGTISVSNITDYTDLKHDPEVRVNFQISLPLVK